MELGLHIPNQSEIRHLGFCIFCAVVTGAVMGYFYPDYKLQSMMGFIAYQLSKEYLAICGYHFLECLLSPVRLIIYLSVSLTIYITSYSILMLFV